MLFMKFERLLMDWFDANGFETLHEDGEWVVMIDDKVVRLTELASALTDQFQPTLVNQ